jgi:translation initiation factor IF-3
MLNVEKVAKVYSGKIGCMCGCLGKYSYNENVEHEDWQGAVNVRTVKMFVKQLMSDPETKYENDYMYVERNGRIKVAYFKEQA